MLNKTYIKVRTAKEGFHYYPNAGTINEAITFLENTHRHLFKIECKIEVFHSDRELEFFLVKWQIEKYLSELGSSFNNKSCEMIGQLILYNLHEQYGYEREYEVVVSEDGESDGIIHYVP